MKKPFIFLLALLAALTLTACGQTATLPEETTPPTEDTTPEEPVKTVYVPVWMQNDSVVYYDAALERTVAQGGDLTDEELTSRPDIDPTSQYGSVLAAPNTKVTYDGHGVLQNIYYLNGLGEYQLSDPFVGTNYVIPQWMQPDSVVCFDADQCFSIRQGGFLTPDEIQNRTDIAQSGGMDADVLRSEPDLRVTYGPDGHLSAIYRVAANGTETAAELDSWPRLTAE